MQSVTGTPRICATIMIVQRAWILGAALLVCAATACGDDGGDVTTRTAPPTLTSPPEELKGYCDASVVMSIVFYDAATDLFLTPEEESAAVARAHAHALQPLVAATVMEAPPEIESELASFAAAVDEAAASGTFAPLETPELVESRSVLSAFNAETCGWPTLSLVTTGRGPIVGVPQQLGPGFHEFRIRNDSDAVRQVDLYRVVDDDAQVPVRERFPAGGPTEPQGVELEASDLILPQEEAVQVVFLQFGEYAFVVAEPEMTSGAVRQFAPDSATPVRVVEGG